MAVEYISYAYPIWAPTDETGKPIPNGEVFFRDNNDKVTLKTVYKDPEGTDPFSNPIILDSGGRINQQVYFKVDPDTPTDLYYIEVRLPSVDCCTLGAIVT